MPTNSFADLPAGQPRRLGIWCDYGFTLSPAQGIGVLVHNLARGLIEADPLLEIVLLICPKDPEDYHDLIAHGQGRIRLYPERWPGRDARLWQRPLRWWLDGVQWCYDAGRALTEMLTELRAAVRVRFQGWLAAALTSAGRGQPLAIGALALCGLLLPLVFLLAWSGWGIGYAVRLLLFPALAFDRVLRRLTAVGHDPVANAAAAQCDVWIIPWINLATPLPTPSILLIHDLVHEHFPAAFADPAQAVRLRAVAAERSAEAAFCACMSAFIRDTDLLGILNLAPSKVHLLPLALPADLPVVSAAEVGELRPTQLRRPYLLYPAGFRPYKNHRLLIEALHVLRAQHGVRELDLVFTGYQELPADLQELVDELGLRDCVHVLDTVDRTTLAALYRGAYATLAPSLYEQGSFPVFEAIQYGCPVACARIPAFVEQCRTLGDAMLYFDPHDPDEAARCVLAIRADRDGVIKGQRQASGRLRKTTWRDVVRLWLPVLQDAVELADWQRQLDRRLLAPWPDTERLPVLSPNRPHVFAFWPRPVPLGIWQQQVELLANLVGLADPSGEFALTVGVPERQAGISDLETGVPGVTVRRIRLNHVSRLEAVQLLRLNPEELAALGSEDFVFVSGAALTALAADAWIVLEPSFPLQLLPARPYVVLAQSGGWCDLGSALARRNLAAGILPTLRGAERVLLSDLGLVRRAASVGRR